MSTHRHLTDEEIRDHLAGTGRPELEDRVAECDADCQDCSVRFNAALDEALFAASAPTIEGDGKGEE